MEKRKLIPFLLLFATVFASGTWDHLVIDNFVESVRKCRDRPAVTIGIVELDENDEIKQEYSNAFGRNDPMCKSNCVRPTNETKFCIGSVTKQFTSGILGAILKQSKNFSETSWDTKLISILGDEGKFFGGNSPADQITLRDILAHRMGIPRYDGSWLLGVAKSRQEIYSQVHKLNATDPSKFWRSSFMYNNWMFGLAGYVAERISGSSWEDLVKKFYFDSLGMKNSEFIHKTNFDNFAKVALQLPDKNWTVVPLSQIGNTSAAVAPAGAICTSSNDFLKYMKFLLTKNSTKFSEDQKILLNAIHEAWEPSNYLPYQEQGKSGVMFRPRYKIANTETTYGLGWSQGVWRDFRYISHGGNIDGWNSMVRIFPDARIGVFVSTTNSVAEQLDCSSLFDDWLSDYVLGYDPFLTNESACTEYPEKWISDLTPPPESKFDFNCKIAEINARPYLGTYEHPVFGTVKVKFVNETMRWEFGYFGRGSLCKTIPNTNLTADDFRMMFDTDTVYNLFNDPTTNEGFGSVFKFQKSDAKNAEKVSLEFIEQLLPPEFDRKANSGGNSFRGGKIGLLWSLWPKIQLMLFFLLIR